MREHVIKVYARINNQPTRLATSPQPPITFDEGLGSTHDTLKATFSTSSDRKLAKSKAQHALASDAFKYEDAVHKAGEQGRPSHLGEPIGEESVHIKSETDRVLSQQPIYIQQTRAASTPTPPARVVLKKLGFLVGLSKTTDDMDGAPELSDQLRVPSEAKLVTPPLMSWPQRKGQIDFTERNTTESKQASTQPVV